MSTSSKLFEPYKLGPITLSNRIVMAPLTRNRAVAGLVPNPLAVDYYGPRAPALPRVSPVAPPPTLGGAGGGGGGGRLGAATLRGNCFRVGPFRRCGAPAGADAGDFSGDRRGLPARPTSKTLRIITFHHT